MESVVLGPFVLEHPLARGGMGEVWRGRHRLEGVPVAVKILRPGSLVLPGPDSTPGEAEERARREALRRFRTEVRAVAALDHPGIVHLLDFGVADEEVEETSGRRVKAGSPYLVMELASGGSLDQLPPLRDWASLRAVALSVLDALAHAHARGVIHRDIKSSNVLMCLSSDLRPGLKLTDFGLAHALGQDTAGRLEGTLHYMAPEQVSGEWRAFGPWTDLYALGCMMWKLATGRPPFHALAGPRLLAAQLAIMPGKFAPSFDVPAGLRPWLLCLLAKNPRDRFKRAADAAAALLQLEVPSGPTPRLEDIARERKAGELELLDPTTLVVPPEDAGGWGAGWRATSFGQSRSDPGVSGEVAAQWRHPVPPPQPMRLVGAGLGLFGVREIRLVGRLRERDLLWKALRTSANQATPQAVMIRGPGGVGKSALARWVCQRAHELGLAEIIRIPHSPLDPPSETIRKGLLRYLRLQDLPRSEVRERLSDLLRGEALEAATELLSPASEGERSPGTPPLFLDTERERHAATLTLLDTLSQERTVIVWLDDAHWGAEGLGLVHFVLDQAVTESRRLAFFLTIQEEDLVTRKGERLRLDALQNRRNAHVLHLGPLNMAERRELVRELLYLQTTLAAQVEERTGGNPLFAMQLVGDWVERNLLAVSESGFVLREGDTAPLPDSLHAVWKQRVERLLGQMVPEAADALERAAALGLEVNGEEWAAVSTSEVARDQVVEALLSAKLAQLTEEGWRFVHTIFRAAVERMARENGRWVGHHAACARMLANRYGRSPLVAERLGRHLLEAGQYSDALDRILEGVDQRKRRTGYRPSLSLLGDAERIMRELKIPQANPRWGELWLTRVVLCKLQGEYDEGLTWARRAADEARKQIAKTPEAGIALHVGLDEKRWGRVLRMALIEQANILLHRHQLVLADGVLEEAVRLSEKAGDLDTLGFALYMQGAAAFERRDFAAADILHVKAESIYRQLKDPDRIADCWRARGNAELHQGNLERADILFRDALRIYEEQGRRLGMAHTTNSLAEVARRRGDLEEAETGYRRALELFDAIGAGQAVIPRLNLGMVMLQRGTIRRSRAPLEYARQVLQNQERLGFLGAANVVLLPALAEAGEWAEWDRTMQEARLLLLQTGQVDPDVAFAARLGGDLAADAGENQRAIDAYTLSRGQYERLHRSEQVRALSRRIASLEALQAG